MLVYEEGKDMITLHTPLREDDILKLNVGDKVLLNGTIFTARDKAHLFLLEENFEKIRNGIIYHCGPIIKDNNVIASGPTTSGRMGMFTPGMIEKYGIKAIIGKGGMDASVLEAMKGKTVYLAAVGGAAVVYAKNSKVRNVYKQKFGMPEAIWELYVRDFPVIVAMDSKGNSIYENVREESMKNLEKLL